MIRVLFSELITAVLLFLAVPSFACTSVIVSGRLRPDGKAVMFKNRDTSNLDNSVEQFQGEKYKFVALVNSDWRTASVSGAPDGTPEAWSGMNEAGFCIMNTATYDLKNDDVPYENMDREGLVMFRALEICATIEDFENFLDTLSRPMGVEANFGVIDGAGGAAYYETDNWHYVKFDVNNEPLGYMVVTNFTRTGRKAERKGVDRYEKACRILAESSIRPGQWNHIFFIEKISRSGAPILRDITASAVVFEGNVMWACLGRPDMVPCLPYMVK